LFWRAVVGEARARTELRQGMKVDRVGSNGKRLGGLQAVGWGEERRAAVDAGLNGLGFKGSVPVSCGAAGLGRGPNEMRQGKIFAQGGVTGIVQVSCKAVAGMRTEMWQVMKVDRVGSNGNCLGGL